MVTTKIICLMMEEQKLSPDLLEACYAYIELTGAEDLKDFEDHYMGEYKNDEVFAMQYAEDIGVLPTNAPWPLQYIDWEHAAKKLMYDYCEQDGHYFRNL